MAILNLLLWPVKWVTECVLASISRLLQATGVPLDSGTVWIISIVALLILVKVAILPLVIASARQNQRLGLLNYDIALLTSAYTTQKSPAAKQRRDDAIRTLRISSDASLWRTYLPLLVQLPVFFALYAVVHTAEQGQAGVGFMNQQLAESLRDASVLGVPLRFSAIANHGLTSVLVVGAVLAVTTAGSQLVAQLLSYRYNVTDQARETAANRIRVITMIAAPLVLLITSLSVPLMMLTYLVASNLWSLWQQNQVMYRYPLPFTEADRVDRLRRRAGF